MATTTPNLGLTKPTVGADADAWGGQLNASLDTLDAKVLDKTTGGSISGAVNVIAATTAPAVRITQTGTGEALRVEDEANPDATPFVIDAAGNVGVGTGTPAHKLDVGGVTRFGAVGSAILAGVGGAFAAGQGELYTVGSSTMGVGTTGAAALRLYTNSVLNATLDSAGNLGLGVTPSAWGSAWKAFDFSLRGGLASGFNETDLNNNVYRNNAGGYLYKQTGFASTYNQSVGSHVWLTAPSGTEGAPITFTQAMTLTQGGNLLVGTTVDNTRFTVQSADAVPAISIVNRSGATNGVALGFDFEGAFGGTDAGSLNFYTTPAQNGASLTERARITSAGDLYVGSSTAPFNTPRVAITKSSQGDPSNNILIISDTAATAVAAMNVWSFSQTTVPSAPFVDAYYNGTAVRVFSVAGNGQISSTSTTITSISDQRVKENIRPLSDGLAAINALQPRMFDWKEGKGRNVKNDRGFIAQEFENVFPDMIEEWKDGDETYKALRADLIPILVKAVQELSAELNALKARL